ncbi:MAG: 3-deoxy-8-phosphooctulonate synthase [Nitrospirota bacterium]
MIREVDISGIRIGGVKPFVLIGGPCVIEDETQTIETARELKEITTRLQIPFIFKSSYDKANRSSIRSYRGPGIKKGLEILKKVKDEIDVPILSDIHSCDEVDMASKVLDILQIPALLCRQTDIILTAAGTGIPVNIKKGQFMSPLDMKNVIEKVESIGNRNIIITERGTSFGYNNLVVDMRSLPIMRSLGYPVIFDGTHSVQLPGGAGIKSSGQREFIAPLCRGAMAVGCDGVFLEIHPLPEDALCDGDNMISLNEIEAILKQLKRIEEAGGGVC